MLGLGLEPMLDVASRVAERSLDRVPFGFRHNLGELELFAPDSLDALARKYVDADFFVATGAPTPATPFYAVPHGAYTPHEALKRLGSGKQRILLKRPERYDRRFRVLLERLFAQVLELGGGLSGSTLVRLDSSILISSAASITPFHFDPEISFFFQVDGDKDYHIFSPAVATEPELERHYVKGIVNIGQLAFEGRDPAHEYVFRLAPGRGMHQPRNAPHWVETKDSPSVSYVFSIETERTRELGRTRAFNHYQRRLGLKPAVPGLHPGRDAVKARAMEVAIPIRKSLGEIVRRSRAGRLSRSN